MWGMSTIDTGEIDRLKEYGNLWFCLWKMTPAASKCRRTTKEDFIGVTIRRLRTMIDKPIQCNSWNKIENWWNKWAITFDDYNPKKRVSNWSHVNLTRLLFKLLLSISHTILISTIFWCDSILCSSIFMFPFCSLLRSIQLNVVCALVKRSSSRAIDWLNRAEWESEVSVHMHKFAFGNSLVHWLYKMWTQKQQLWQSKSNNDDNRCPTICLKGIKKNKGKRKTHKRFRFSCRLFLFNSDRCRHHHHLSSIVGRIVTFMLNMSAYTKFK